MLDKALQRVAHLAKHDYLVCVISDFSGITNDTQRLIKMISRHNDVMLAVVYDPSAKKLSAVGTFVVSDGERQIVLDSSSVNHCRFANLLIRT